MVLSAAQSSTSSVDTDGNPVTKEYIQTMMRKHENNDSITVKSISSTKISKAGDNFIADVFRVKIEAKVSASGKTAEITRNFVVKVPAKEDKNTPPEIFKYESKFYNHVLGPLEKAIKSELSVLRCMNAEEAVVVTEDFQKGDWVLPKRQDGMDLNQCEQVLASLAKLHAASIILQTNDKAKFDEVTKHLQDQVYSPVNEPICRRTLTDSYAIAKYYLEEYAPKASEIEAEAIKRFNDLTGDKIFDAAKAATHSTPDSIKVLVHGECWANNVMLKEDTKGDYALLINLSTVCLASPARDFAYLFATNPKQVEIPLLIKFYVDELHNYLKNAKIPTKVIDQFSYEIILDEWKRLEMVSLLTALWLLIPISCITYPSPEEVEKTADKDKPKLVAKHVDIDFYNRRLIDIIVQYHKKF